ncbi:MAG: epimerase [Oligoflexia bacterium]|nr:MAG: epimerase [Oligoflexia bacterium]
MAKVLVTGANGFLGSWLVKGLLNEGHEVSVLVRKNSDVSELAHLSCHYLYGDITNRESLIQAFQGQDSVFHLAGLIAYKKSEREKMDLINVGGVENVIHACKLNSVRRLVHLSSVTAIGAGFRPNQVLNENSEYNVHHLNLGYFETKHQGELLVREACAKKEIDAVILNPSTIYGPGDAKKGSRKTQIKVARGEFPFYTSGGVNVVAVEDVVHGILSAWNIGRTGERYILAGENLTIEQLFTEIARAANVEPPRLYMPNFALHTLGYFGDLLSTFGFSSSISSENAWTATLYHWFDSTKAQNELHFCPSSARQAIEKSVGWMAEHGLLK